MNGFDKCDKCGHSRLAHMQDACCVRKCECEGFVAVH